MIILGTYTYMYIGFTVNHNQSSVQRKRSGQPQEVPWFYLLVEKTVSRGRVEEWLKQIYIKVK